MNFGRFVSDAELCGFLDGEVSAARASEIAAAVRSSPDLQRKLRAWREQSQWLRASFGRIAQEPVPDMLRQAVPAHRLPSVAHEYVLPPSAPVAQKYARGADIAIWKLLVISLIGLFLATALYAGGVVTGTQACAPTLIQKWMDQPESLRGS